MSDLIDMKDVDAVCIGQRAADMVDVENGRVKKALYSDPEIFEEELDLVFNKTWVFVGHESEVPEKGSFKTAWIGRHPVIMSRDRKMNIHVLQNRCRHRGATVCEGRKGKTNAFTCPYHGWGYGLDGSLRALPKPEEYDGVFDKDEMPLEYRLLEFFVLHQNRVFSRGQLLDRVWGGNVYVDERTVDVHIRRLRKALAPEQQDEMIQTVRGAGYRFSPVGSSAKES